ncbi:MAG TPA: PAS domain S-box protein [Chitinophagaceae bacterium]|nr:PAS domain S-box protein [Chitinophagaceae bacterium]
MTYELPNRFAGLADVYIALFDALPGNSLLLQNDAPTYTILAATPQYLKERGTSKKDLIGKGVFEAPPSNFQGPGNTGETEMLTSLALVLQHKEPVQLPVRRYDVKMKDGSVTKRYWQANNTPVLTPDGEVACIIHTVADITGPIEAKTPEEGISGAEKAYHLFMNAPVIIGILKGDNYIIELANEGLLEVWGRTADVVGKPLLAVIPELKEQGFITLLDQVRSTGEPFYAYEFPITLNRYGKEQVLYFDFVYKPIYEDGVTNKASGIVSVGHDVTNQVIARKKEQESEAKYRSLFEAVDQGFCVLEMIFDENNLPADYRFLEVNPAFEQQTGLKNALGKTARELIPNLEFHWIELYGKVALDGEPIRFSEGSEAMGRWFDVYAFGLGDSDIKKVALLFTDISERKRTEELNRKSEQNLRNTLLQAPVAMAIFKGPRFIVEIANNHMYELFGRGEEELLGKSIFVALPEVSNQGYEELLSGVYTTGERFTAFGTPVTLPRDGTVKTVYVNLLYEAFREVDGTISGVIAVATDVTEQVTARMKVEESHNEFQFVTDFMPQLIWVTRADGYHYYYNKQWYDYTGLTYGETEGEGWNRVFHPDDQPRAWEAWQNSLETGKSYEIEYRCRRHDGQYRWFLGRALPLRDATGAILKWFGTCTDIDDQKREAEIMELRIKERTEELQKSNLELSRSNQNLEEFAHAASHDLKEPIRKIHYFTQHLKELLGRQLSESEARAFNRIENATERMGNLIDDLLLYSHVSQRPLQTEEVDLRQKVQRVLEDLELDIEEKSAVIHIGDLPVVRGYRRQLQQLFQNLISNALKYSKAGEPPRITIVSNTVIKNDKHYSMIEVKDNGIGFEQQYADKIFQMFSRLHGKGEYSGTGVGLSIVKKVVENQNGFIEVESAPGVGTNFKVYLPL